MFPLMLSSDQPFSTDELDLNHRKFESVYLKCDKGRGRGGWGGRHHVYRHSRTSQSQTNPRYWSSLVRAKKNTNEKSNAFGKLAAACKALSLSYLDVGLVDEVEITGIPDESFRTAGRYDSSAATQQILLIFYSSMH
jgi:hypothetical protein